MGATKRAAASLHLCVKHDNRRLPDKAANGPVWECLASSGSVIPLFRSQTETVAHSLLPTPKLIVFYDYRGGFSACYSGQREAEGGEVLSDMGELNKIY